jgi:hypothetical protein
MLLAGARHAGGTMVIGGNGQGPAAQFFVVLTQQLGGRMGGPNGVAPFVQHVAHLHEPFAGGTRELPYAGRAELAVGVRLKEDSTCGR